MPAKGQPWGQVSREQSLQRRMARRLALTPTEAQCLQLVGDGMTSREAGDKLCLTARTVQWHLNNVLDKMGCTTTRRAYVEAIRTGQCVCPCQRSAE